MCKKTNHPDQSDLFEPENQQKASRERATYGTENPFSPENMKKRRQEAQREQDETMEALLLLCRTANGGSGQCHHVRRFLLGLYNSNKWPFELIRLRNLDRNLRDACLRVLELDIKAYQEIHEYVKDGDELWKKWWKWEEGNR